MSMHRLEMSLLQYGATGLRNLLASMGLTVARRGTGTPEGVVTGSIGDLYVNLSGGAATTLYVKTSGTNTDTGWTAK